MTSTTDNAEIHESVKDGFRELLDWEKENTNDNAFLKTYTYYENSIDKKITNALLKIEEYLSKTFTDTDDLICYLGATIGISGDELHDNPATYTETLYYCVYDFGRQLALSMFGCGAGIHDFFHHSFPCLHSLG